MTPTPYPDVNDVIEQLASAMRRALGNRLSGLYLYGSLVTGDFDHVSSDIDLVAVLPSDLTEAGFERLHGMHDDFARAHPRWDDRIEVAYITASALRTFRVQPSIIAVISPGEPFHWKEAGRDWLMNWYVVREYGKTLTGPPPQTFIAPISQEEYVSAVYQHAMEWREWVAQTYLRKSQAYAILTMCRALYTLTTGAYCSKKQAAAWAERTWPEWSGVIEQALAWREAWQDENVDHAATIPQTRRFVHFAAAECERIAGL